MIEKHIVLAIIIAIPFLYILCLKSFNVNNHERSTGPRIAEENPLDGCVNVYLDMGSNIGVQIRWEMKMLDHNAMLKFILLESFLSKILFLGL